MGRFPGKMSVGWRMRNDYEFGESEAPDTREPGYRETILPFLATDRSYREIGHFMIRIFYVWLFV